MENGRKEYIEKVLKESELELPQSRKEMLLYHLVSALNAMSIDPRVIASAVQIWLDDHPEATTTVQDGAITRAKLHADLEGDLSELETSQRITSLDETVLANGAIIEALNTPTYVSDASNYSEYNLTETGWYVFARITAKSGTTVTANTNVEGAAGYIAEVGEDHVDVAVKFEVAAMSQMVTVNWGAYTDVFVIKASDLAIRNLDYRTTFYVYDVAPFTTWEFELTTDTTFVEGKHYYTKEGDVYTEAEVTVGETIPISTYYVHTKVRFEGMARNITYKCDTVIDCPMEFVLPEIEDDTHGCWFEIRCRHAGEYSMTLIPPSDDIKIATEHTQRETAGVNMINLHYTSVGGTKIWRFMNTHSSIPA